MVWIVLIDDGPGRMVVARDGDGSRAAFTSELFARLWAEKTCREPFEIVKEV